MSDFERKNFVEDLAHELTENITQYPFNMACCEPGKDGKTRFTAEAQKANDDFRTIIEEALDRYFED